MDMLQNGDDAKLSALEAIVAKQNEEIGSLKAQVDDCIKRIQVLETESKSNSSHSSNSRSVPATKPRSAGRGSARTPRDGVGATGGVGAKSSIVKKTSASSARKGSIPKQKGYAKEASFHKDEGYIRMILRGRPINLYCPSNIVQSEDNSKAPDQKLALEWVYGYRGKDCRSNLYQLASGELIYFIAATVVLYNLESKTQRFYTGHNDDVKCLALHPDKVIVATGQVAGHDKKEGKPHVRVWDANTLATLHIVGLGSFDRAVSCIAFSRTNQGLYLCAIDESNDHVISIWDWKRGHRMAETKCSGDPILDVTWHATDPNSIVAIGKAGVFFWTLENGKCLTRKLGIYDKFPKPKFVLCMAFSDAGDVVTGDSNGNIFLWNRSIHKIEKAVLDAHTGGVFSVAFTPAGTLISGGKDGKIIEWDAEYAKTGRELAISELQGSVRTLVMGNDAILVGTRNNRVLQIQADFSGEPTPIVEGHMDELWGVSCFKTLPKFMSVGYDKQAFMWDAATHSVQWALTIPEQGHCIALHPNDNFSVIGTTTPNWYVIDCTTHEVVFSGKDGSEQIECVEFSPDGTLLALGSRDNHIYLYQVKNDGAVYSHLGSCSGHSSYITHLDWSVDSRNLRSNSGDYELLFWEIGLNCGQVTSSEVFRNIEWATQNCTLTFSVCGIWPEGADGTDINACAVSAQRHLLASGDDFGKVNLFSYPCGSLRAKGHHFKGHSSHVTNVRFLAQDAGLISTGGKDMAVIQWKIV